MCLYFMNKACNCVCVQHSIPHESMRLQITMSSLVLSTEREQYNVSESFGDDGVIYVWKLLFFIDFLLIERSLLFSDREK